jgi:hypothetical protein
MTQILVQGSAVLACGPFTDDGDNLVAHDGVFPKHVMDGWAVVECAVPEDFVPAAYEWDGAQLVAKPQPVPVPERVYRRQAVQALIDEGKLGLVQLAINALDDGTEEGARMKLTAQNEWDNSLEFYRDRALLIQLAGAIGYDTPEKLDALFVKAAGL